MNAPLTIPFSLLFLFMQLGAPKINGAMCNFLVHLSRVHLSFISDDGPSFFWFQMFPYTILVPMPTQVKSGQIPTRFCLFLWRLIAHYYKMMAYNNLWSWIHIITQKLLQNWVKFGQDPLCLQRSYFICTNLVAFQLYARVANFLFREVWMWHPLWVLWFLIRLQGRPFGLIFETYISKSSISPMASPLAYASPFAACFPLFWHSINFYAIHSDLFWCCFGLRGEVWLIIFMHQIFTYFKMKFLNQMITFGN